MPVRLREEVQTLLPRPRTRARPKGGCVRGAIRAGLDVPPAATRLSRVRRLGSRSTRGRGDACVDRGGRGTPAAAERERIVRAHAHEFPGVWRSLVDDLGDEHEAEQLVLIGAVVAAFGEVRSVDPSVLELIEENEAIAEDPVEALAIAIEATDLWSIGQAAA